MIERIDPRITIGVAFILLVIGLVLPVLMVMQYLPSTFLLNFLAYASSFLGVILGLVGAVFIAVRGRKKDM